MVELPGALRVRHVHVERFDPRVAIPRRPGHADDRDPRCRRIRRSPLEPLADRRLVRPELLRHRRADDHHGRATVVVAGRDVSSLLQRDAGSLQVSGRHCLVVDERLSSLRDGIGTVERERIVKTVRTGERTEQHAAGGRYAWQLRHARDRIAIELPRLRGIVVLGLWQEQLGGQRMRAIESERCSGEPREAAQQHAAADQQYDGQRDFRRNERSLRSPRRAAGRRAPGRRTQHTPWLHARAAERGEHTEQQRRHHHQRRREQRDPHVDLDHACPIEVGRHHRADRAAPRHARRQPHRRSDPSQHHRLGQELTDEPGAARA